MSRVILGGKQTTKFANARNRGWLFIFSQNEKILVSQNVQFEFRQVLRHYCCCRYCIHKNNNDQLPPIIAINVFKMNFFTFCFVLNKQTRSRFLVFADFITCLPPEKQRNTAFYPIGP